MVVSPFPRFLLSIVLALCSVADLIAARRGALCRYAPNTCVCSFPFLIESLRRPRTLAETVPQGFTKTKTKTKSNKIASLKNFKILLIASLATRFRIKERNCVRLYDLNDTKDSEKPKLQREGKGQAEANERETSDEKRATRNERPRSRSTETFKPAAAFCLLRGRGGKGCCFLNQRCLQPTQ